MDSNTVKSTAFSGAGGLLVFAMILPGIVAYGVVLILFPSSAFPSESFQELTISVLLLGLFSNISGHLLGPLIRGREPGNDHLLFDIYAASYKLPQDVAERLRKDAGFWFSYYTWYWNTAVGVSAVLAARIGLMAYDPTRFEFKDFEGATFIVAVLVVLALVYKARSIIKNIRGLVDGLNESDHEIIHP